MNINDMLCSDSFLVNLKGTSKKQVLEELSKLAEIKLKINSRTLDSFNLENIALIKIDVQGWEKKVLKGAEETLKRCKPLLIIEFENHQLLKTNTSVEELIAYIKQLDYYIFYLDYSYPSDHVCVHKSEIDYFRSNFKKYIYEHTEDNPINNNLKLGIFEKIKVIN